MKYNIFYHKLKIQLHHIFIKIFILNISKLLLFIIMFIHLKKRMIHVNLKDKPLKSIAPRNMVFNYRKQNKKRMMIDIIRLFFNLLFSG